MTPPRYVPRWHLALVWLAMAAAALPVAALVLVITPVARMQDWLVRKLNQRNGCCLLGWHRWEWRFEQGATLALNAPPPAHAKCARCGVEYGKSNKPTRAEGVEG